MTARIFLFIFVVLFASQTVAAVFDSHAPHQSNATHNANVEHDNHQEVIASLDDTTAMDCHHCCHCHTPSSTAVLITEYVSIIALESEKLHISSVFANSTSVAPEHRPPIA
ncbi:MAG: hypothetical protein ACPGSN_07235 [Psychrobium sp.]